MDVAELLLAGAARPLPPWPYWLLCALLVCGELGRGGGAPQRWPLLAVIALCTSLAHVYHLVFHPAEVAAMMRAEAEAPAPAHTPTPTAAESAHKEGEEGEGSGGVRARL